MSLITSEFEEGVGRITLNRPEKRNALTREFIEQLLAGVREMEKRPDLRVLVFQATGKVFCAGMDLSEMQQRATSAHASDDWQRDSQVYCDLLTTIFSLPVPTIAAIQGPVLAGGIGLILACDLLIAAESVFFALPEPMRGITAAMVTPLLMHRVGAGAASYMLLSGEQLSAVKGQQTGMIHDVVPDESLTKRVELLLKNILSGSPAALAITKKQIIYCSAADIVKQVSESIEVSATARATDDAREGLAAYLEKRKPRWQT